ncbi:MAG: ABC transporter ATP-binding protein [Sphaerobacteraceae bacterium]|nr:MAG: ABC transporter ATP-binding protein [Sphaerobacteraceae bacterium]
MSDGATVVTDLLTRQFGERLALDSVTLSVSAGEVFGLLGHNGAGKTTAVRLLNGLLTPTSGVAQVLGLSPVDDGPQIRARTGVLTETPALDDRLTGRENLRFFARVFGLSREEATQRTDELIEMFGLSDRGGEQVAMYSRGMRQRIALARTMLHKPEILFLDEPTSGLDPVASRQVQDMVIALQNQGTTILLCTHNLEEAERVCNRVAVLEQGRVIALGSPRELASEVSPPQIEIEVDPAHKESAASLISELHPELILKTDEETLVRIEGLARSDIPVVLRALALREIDVYQVTSQQLSLEDVYFALHQRMMER